MTEMSKWDKEKAIVLNAALKMSQKGLVTGKTGNVSLRLSDEGGKELLAITPSRREYDLLTPDEILVVGFDGKLVEGNLPPSVELMMHAGVYKARKDAGAVIHFHPIYATVMAVAGLDIPPIVEDQVLLIGGEIKLAKIALSGSDELVKNVVEGLEDRNGVLLPHHGAVGIGRTMREAFTVCEIIEKTAKIYYCALALGRVTPMPAEALETDKAWFKTNQGGG
jgi:L-fuculose-phosphate aldolase